MQSSNVMFDLKYKFSFQAEELLLSLGFEASDLDTVDQKNCFAPSEVDYNLIYDQDGFR